MPGVNVAELRLFSRVQEELTVNEADDLILRGTHIVIPSALHQRTLALAYEGHQGIVKTKQLLREKIRFPKLTLTIPRLPKGRYQNSSEYLQHMVYLQL